MNIWKYKYSKGFTLIELLVVIAIIGMLSTIVLSSLQVARAKSRDARRVQDISQIMNALALYYDTYGHFPCHELMSEANTDNSDNPNFLRPLVTLKYISDIPHDPSYGKTENIGYYEYGTYTNVAKNVNDPSDPNRNRCGDIAFVGLYTEFADTKCPTFGQTSYDSNAPGHCHIWYPTIPPAPCAQYAFANFDVPPCFPFRDVHSQNDPLFGDL